MIILSFFASVLIAGFTGYFVRKMLAKAEEAKIVSAEVVAKKIVEEGEKSAKAAKREALLEAKEEVHRQRSDFERENKERRNEVNRIERRITQKEESLDRKIDQLEKKEDSLKRTEKEMKKREEKLNGLYQEQSRELERVSGLTAGEAQEILLSRAQDEIKHEMAIMVKEIETEAKEEGEKRARNIVTLAIQKCAADHVSESTVSVVTLPSDEMKGRIIGREGRNIRALEAMTGIDLIIDDTPEAVILSGFDPIRREIARISLENLVADGRIHPARIEEMVVKARQEVDALIKEEGEQATFTVGVHGLHHEMIKLLGKLKFRTSYGQNVLKHSIEVAHLAGVMAAELGLDITMAKRAGLLHDIGKAVDHEVEGPHVVIGADLAKRYKESPAMVNAIAAHHGDFDPQTLEAVLIQAADAISAARPGARRETLEAYIKRLENLEEIANSFEGVEKSYAIQAGREIRIMVKPEKVDDNMSAHIAREIAKKIEGELEYPGQIKVTLIREVRVVNYAK